MPSLKLCTTFLFGCLLVSGCSSQSSNATHPAKQGEIAPAIVAKQGQKLGIVALFKKLEIGMRSEQVEAIVGAPVLTPLEGPGEDLRVYYLGREYAERSLLPHESPIAPAGIFVTYRHGTLVEKGYNSQWVRSE